MIGVQIHDSTEREWVSEFFEMFKTPWEFCRPGQRYPVLLATRWGETHDAGVVILYGSESGAFERERGIPIDTRRRTALLRSGSRMLPIYGEAAAFRVENGAVLHMEGARCPAAFTRQEGSRLIYRVGYDLFREIRRLLTSGQPAENAIYPTLELHIALLRSWILRAGVEVAEIPPSPPGYDFMVCLTHDVDFASIRDHRLDHTMAGFLYRALVGSAIDVVRGRGGWGKLITNWKAALLLPAVYAGLAKDFWIQYERYLEIERGLKSTFYLIPFKNRPGTGIGGSSPARRACKYDVTEVRTWTARILARGGEIGLHGLDAWRDPQSARQEMERIREHAPGQRLGVRMHWLYFGPDSPEQLEKGGLLYDSTCGYNDAVGFRAGTGQVFRPCGAKELLELPLIVQDTALFYKGRMGLSEEEALSLCRKIIGRLREFGGVLVINWHQRSLAPERLWGGFYRKLLEEIGRKRVLFVTAREAVEWFSLRRSAVFDRAEGPSEAVRLAHPAGPDAKERLSIRRSRPRSSGRGGHGRQGRSRYPRDAIPARSLGRGAGNQRERSLGE